MRVTNGASECVGGIGARQPRQAKQAAHHFLHLFFFRLAITDNSLLDLQRGVFRKGQVSIDHRANRRSARLSQQQGGLRINVDEYFLQRSLFGVIGRNHFAQAFQDGFEPLGQWLIGGWAYAAAGDIDQTTAGRFDYAEPSDPQPRVYA